MSNVSHTIGKYEIKGRLGSGSFATVYLAHDPALDVDVALKVLAANWCADEGVEGRFLQEARLLFKLNDPRVVKVYFVGEHDDGCPYFVMDYADRGNLEERIAARMEANQPFGIEEALRISRGIAECLTVVHAAGIVHRDLKPSNVLYRSDPDYPGGERMLLGDFGVARSLEAGARHTIVAGSPFYMAPEQAQEETAGTADQRADIYSAAVILYELLAGRVPYPYQTLSEIRQAQLTGVRTPLRQLRSGIPGTVAWIVDKGMELDPNDRFPSIEAWTSALDTAIAGLDDQPVAQAAAVAVASMEATFVPQAGTPGGVDQTNAAPVAQPAGATVQDLQAAPMGERLEGSYAPADDPAQVTQPLARVQWPDEPPNAAPADDAPEPTQRRWGRRILVLLVLLVLLAAAGYGAALYLDLEPISSW